MPPKHVEPPTVFSTLMPGGQRGNRPQTRVYDVKGVNAKQLTGHSWTIKYGDNSTANGQVFLDKVTIGDVSVEKQAVEAAKWVSGSFSKDKHNDGLLGLAFSKINTVKPSKQLTWFDNARSKLAEPVFTCALKRRQPGTYDFGYVDKAKYKGDIVWADVKGAKGLWDFSATGYAVGKGATQMARINAIADTGSSLWYLPRAVADAYWKQVPGAAVRLPLGWTFPCSSKLPDMTMIISGKKVTVPGINMNYQTVGGSTCFGGIQRDVGLPFSIAGDVFLKNQFVIHKSDGKTAKIGFAQSSVAPT